MDPCEFGSEGKSAPSWPWHPAEVDPARTRALRRRVFGAPKGGRYRDRLAPGDVHLALFDRGGAVVAAGGIQCEPFPPEPGLRDHRLRGLAVDLHLRRRGLGRLLIGALLARAKAAGAERVWARVRAENLAFYLAVGARPAEDPNRSDAPLVLWDWTRAQGERKPLGIPRRP